MKTEIIGKSFVVEADYNEMFRTAARKLGGKYGREGWVFDARDEERVRAELLRCYGDNGAGITDYVDVRVSLPSGTAGENVRKYMGGYTSSLTLFGRPVARAYGRDSGAEIGSGVVVESGDFDSGGSAKNWNTRALENTTFLMRDVAQQAYLEIAEQVKNEADCEIQIELLTKVVDAKDALIAEREQLLRRLAEIEAELAP